MRWDELNLPRDNGANDKQDSARLAGLLAVFGWPCDLSNIKLYYQDGRYVRHPGERLYDFSRDQAICLMAGLHVTDNSHLVSRKFVDGADIFSPSQMGHVRRCQGKKAYFWQDWWLWLDVWYSCFFESLAEPNQLLCMLLLADKKYLNFWLKHNKQWREAIIYYWATSYRGEKELAAHMIESLLDRQGAFA